MSVDTSSSSAHASLATRAMRGDGDVVLQRYEYSTSAPIDLVTSRDPGAPTLLRKDLSPGSVLAQARDTRPSFVQDPRREIAVYSQVLPSWLRAPAFHGAVDDRDAGRHLLFLEHVNGVELWQVGELDVWVEVARWLASMHAAHLEADASPEVRSLLLRYDAEHLRTWAARAAAFATAGAGVERVLEHHDELVERLLALPQSFIHGELYPSNVLVGPADGGRPRVAAIDWETAAVGPSLVDLAALVEGWDDDAVGMLLAAYRAAMAGRDPDAAGAVTDDALNACRLHQCIRWLGWCRGWSPPDEHARDWLALALDLTARLGW